MCCLHRPKPISPGAAGVFPSSRRNPDVDGNFAPGGVATVVTKLFNCVRPMQPSFGKKDLTSS